MAVLVARACGKLALADGDQFDDLLRATSMRNFLELIAPSADDRPSSNFERIARQTPHFKKLAKCEAISRNARDRAVRRVNEALRTGRSRTTKLRPA